MKLVLALLVCASTTTSAFKSFPVRQPSADEETLLVETAKPALRGAADGLDGLTSSGARHLAFGAETTCDPSQTNLLDFEAWKREEGFWFGEYTFLGGDGNPFVSGSWNYRYDQYFGFIHLQLNGNKLKQRNVFLYPPQTAEKCAEDDSVVGDGACSVNGNEKVFEADQEASDCDGNLAGPFGTPPFVLDTATKILGDDTVLYTVTYPAEFGGGVNQNQLTTLPGNGVRVRTAQGFDPEGQPSYASFYREQKLDKAAWMAKLAEVRAANSILASDECAWKTGAGTTDPSGVTCEEHFGFAV